MTDASNKDSWMNEVRELGQELIEQGEVSHTHEVLPAICSRRSIRQFTDTPLSGEDVQILLEAGLRAPSSRGAHTTQFILVEGRETLTELSYMRPDGADFLRQVPLGIVILGSPMECERWIADASLAQAISSYKQKPLVSAPAGQMSSDKIRPMGKRLVSTFAMY